MPLADAAPPAVRDVVLVCDDEPNMRGLIRDVLEDDGFEVVAAESGERALGSLFAPDSAIAVVVLDLAMPGIDGFEVIRRTRARGIEVSIIVITAFGTVDTAVRAMQAGAADFLVKPFDNAQLRASVRRCLERRDLLAQAQLSLPQLVGADAAPLAIIGEDARLQSVFGVVRKIADLKTSVLITGESGTGKELVAQAIHFNGARREKPFVAVNCAALPEALLESEFFGHERGAFTGAHSLQRGKFELADGGTLFLDEIGEMPLGLQAKFLRVLQDQRFARVGGEKELRVDVRVIAATNRDLMEACRRRDFREDLYYRLAVIPVLLPPLRERVGDIPHLIHYFNQRFSQRHKLPALVLSRDLLEAAGRRRWPGNIRELQNTVEKAIVLQEPELLAHDPHPTGYVPPWGEAEKSTPPSHESSGGSRPEPVVAPAPPRASTLADTASVDLGQGGDIRPLADVANEAQRAALIRALQLCEGNKVETARRLGVSLKTLYNRIHELGISISTRIE